MKSYYKGTVMHDYFLTTHEVTLFKNNKAVKNTELYGNLYEVVNNFQGKKDDTDKIIISI